MKILLTGSCGYIGSNLMKLFYFKDYEIVEVDKQLDKKITDLQQDDVYGVECVIHLGSNCNVEAIEKDKNLAYENLESTKHLMKLFSSNEKVRFIFGSSCHAIEGRNMYGMTKFVEESMIQKLMPKHSILRIYSAVGGHIDPKSNVTLARILRAAAEKKEVEFSTKEPTDRMGYVHITRVCNAIDMQIKQIFGSDMQHVCSEDYFNFEQVVQAVEEILGYKIARKHIESGLANKHVDQPDFTDRKNKVGDLNRAILDYLPQFGLKSKAEVAAEKKREAKLKAENEKAKQSAV